jgi:hypothetical protein
MSTFSRRLIAVFAAGFFVLAVSSARASDKKFLGSDDAKEKDEPQTFLPDYDKLTKGHEADWVYFPEGSLTKYKTVSVEEFDHTGHGDSRDAAREGKDYMEQWLEAGFWSRQVRRRHDRRGASSTPGSPWAARYWGGWAANPGVGLKLLIKANGKVVGEMRHKAKGSTIRDAVENGLEDMTKDIGKAK